MLEGKDWIFAMATLLAPLFAVQVSQYLERQRRRADEQIKVFSTLMATRAATLSQKHVEALNLIDVVFNAKRDSEKAIRSQWKAYLDHLSDKRYPRETWGARRVELLVDLLYTMAIHLGFDFDKTHIKTQNYFPDGWGRDEENQLSIRHALAETLNGKRSFPIWVTGITQPPVPDTRPETREP